MSRTRLDGIDAARGLAFAGMLLAHFVHTRTAADPGWLQGIDNAANGRAAPLFCVLLGVGGGLYAGRRGRAALARRGLVILTIGVLLWPMVKRVFLILPHYGVLLVVVAACMRLRTRTLLALTAVSWLVPSMIVALVDDPGLRGGAEPRTYGALRDVGHLAWQITWSGGYPIVGWIGFALAGLCVSRLRLTDARVLWRLVVGGAVVAATQPLFALAFTALDGRRRIPEARGLPAFFDGWAHSNQTAWYLVAAASAVAVIGVCLLAARRLSLAPLALLGRYALTVYLLHLLVGAHLVWPWKERAEPSLVLQFGVAAVTLAALGLFAYAWSRRFARGPAEFVVRAVK
jgi:uncharacterized membrane protein YeiB